jgi:hypothetical protein
VIVSQDVIVTRGGPTLQRIVIELSVDERKVIELLGERAASNRSGKAAVLFGAVRCRVVRNLDKEQPK